MENQTTENKKEILEIGINLAVKLYQNSIIDEIQNLNEQLVSAGIVTPNASTNYIQNLDSKYCQIGTEQWSRTFEVYNQRNGKLFQYNPKVSWSSMSATATKEGAMSAGEFLTILSFVVNDVEQNGYFSQALKSAMENLRELENNIADLRNALSEIKKEEAEKEKHDFISKLNPGVRLEGEHSGKRSITITKITDKNIFYTSSRAVTGSRSSKFDFYNEFKNYQII